MDDPVTVTSSILTVDPQEPFWVSAPASCAEDKLLSHIRWKAGLAFQGALFRSPPFLHSFPTGGGRLVYTFQLYCWLVLLLQPPTRPPHPPGSFPLPPLPIHPGGKSQEAHFTINSACWAAKPAQHYEEQVPSLLIPNYPSFITVILSLSRNFPTLGPHINIWTHLYRTHFQTICPHTFAPSVPQSFSCALCFPVSDSSPDWELCYLYIQLICVSSGICLPTLMGFALL